LETIKEWYGLTITTEELGKIIGSQVISVQK